MNENEYSDEFLKRAIEPKQIEALIAELAKVDRAGRRGVELELHDWTKSLLPLLRTVQDIANQDLNKYWRIINFLSTKEFFVDPIQHHKTEGVFNVLTLLPQTKADFILGEIEDITPEQLQDLQFNLLNKDKCAFIQSLRRTKYESIINQCWVIGLFAGIQCYMNQEEEKRNEILNLIFKKGLVSNVEVDITDAVHNRMVDLHHFFMMRYAMFKRPCDGSLANVFLALALSFNYESFDYFLVLMHTIGIKVYDCVVWLFLEYKDGLLAEDSDAIYSVLHNDSPKEFDLLLDEYIVCDTQEEVKFYENKYFSLLDVNQHSRVYSYFGEEDLSGNHKMFLLPIRQDLSCYQLDFLSISQSLMLDAQISCEHAIPRNILAESQKQSENTCPKNNSSDVQLPNEILTNGQNSTQQPEPEQESSCVNNQTIPDVLSPAQNKKINDFEIRPTYFDEKQKYTNFQLLHCVIKNEKFKGIEPEKRAKDFESLVKLLARNLCIYPSNKVMKSCAYALTGIGFKSPFEPIPVYWNHKKVDILLFICQKLYNSGEKSAMTDFKTAVDVFHVRKEFENIKNPSLEGSKVNDTGFGKKFNEIYPEL